MICKISCDYSINFFKYEFLDIIDVYDTLEWVDLYQAWIHLKAKYDSCLLVIHLSDKMS